MAQRSNSIFIKQRQRVIRLLMKKGYPLSKIVRKLQVIEDGKYAVARITVQRDMEEIKKRRENWDKIHNPYQMDVYEKQRQDLIQEYDDLIRKAKKKKQFKTASEIIAKKARLLGVDKFTAPASKKKDEIEEKFKNKTQEEINEVLFQEFKDLSAAIIRMALRGEIGNIKRITVRVVREEEKGKPVKYVLSRFGEEKKLYREQEGFKK